VRAFLSGYATGGGAYSQAQREAYLKGVLWSKVIRAGNLSLFMFCIVSGILLAM